MQFQTYNREATTLFKMKIKFVFERSKIKICISSCIVLMKFLVYY